MPAGGLPLFSHYKERDHYLSTSVISSWCLRSEILALKRCLRNVQIIIIILIIINIIIITVIIDRTVEKYELSLMQAYICSFCGLTAGQGLGQG